MQATCPLAGTARTAQKLTARPPVNLFGSLRRTVSRFSQPVTLQRSWLMPQPSSPPTHTPSTHGPEGQMFPLQRMARRSRQGAWSERVSRDSPGRALGAGTQHTTGALRQVEHFRAQQRAAHDHRCAKPPALTSCRSSAGVGGEGEEHGLGELWASAASAAQSNGAQHEETTQAVGAKEQGSTRGLIPPSPTMGSIMGLVHRPGTPHSWGRDLGHTQPPPTHTWAARGKEGGRAAQFQGGRRHPGAAWLTCCAAGLHASQVLTRLPSMAEMS